MKKTLLAVALAPLCLQSYAFAAETSPDEVMVVTANRFEQPKSSIIAQVDILTKEDITAMQARSLTDVLVRMPGIQVTNNGGAGQASSISLRGGSSKHVIVLIDGVRFGSSTLGYSNYSSIPVSGIERIELLRGPRAVIYGADAVSGVINIITTSKPEVFEGELTAGVGSFGYYQTKGSIAGGLGDKAWGKVGVNYEQADGFDISDDSWPESQPDDDGYEKADIVAELGMQITEHLQGQVSGFYSMNNSDYEYYRSGPNSLKSPNESEVALYNVAGQLKYDADNYSSTLVLAKNRDETKNKGGEEPGSKIATDRDVVNWINTFAVSTNTRVLAGIDYSKDSVADSQLWDSWGFPEPTFKSYDSESRKNTAGYVSVSYSPAVYQLEAAVRYDDNEQFDDFTTWQLGAGWNLSETLRLTASAGTAFQAPTYNDLYWPDYGNPDLKPEESLTYELGIAGSTTMFDWQITGYKTVVDNLIQYQGKDTQLESSDVDIKGLELQTSFMTGPLYHNLSLDLLDTAAKVQTSGFGEPLVIEEKELARRANENLKWNMSYLADNWQADLFYIYQGDRYDDTKNEVKLDAYHLVDLTGSYFITSNVTVRGRIANLFDEDYQTAAGYNTAERNYSASVSYQF